MKFLAAKKFKEGMNLLNFALGFTKDEIEDNVQISNTTRNGFDVRYGDGGQGSYMGKNLKYTTVDTPSGPNQAPSEGKITGYQEKDGGSVHFSISAKAFFRVSGTSSDKDNRKLWDKELKGKDVFKLGAGDDKFDLSKGNDKGYGGGGDDLIYGGAGNDKLYGENGDDFLFAGAGKDRIWGGDGADEFGFDGKKQGTNTVKDFETGLDEVYIDVKGVNGLRDLDIDTKKGDVHIAYAKTKIILEDAARGFDADDDIAFG